MVGRKIPKNTVNQKVGMPMSNIEMSARLREVCNNIRMKSYALVDLIPLLQKTADMLDSDQRQIFVLMDREKEYGETDEIIGWTPDSKIANAWRNSSSRNQSRRTLYTNRIDKV